MISLLFLDPQSRPCKALLNWLFGCYLFHLAWLSNIFWAGFGGLLAEGSARSIAQNRDVNCFCPQLLSLLVPLVNLAHHRGVNSWETLQICCKLKWMLFFCVVCVRFSFNWHNLWEKIWSLWALFQYKPRFVQSVLLHSVLLKYSVLLAECCVENRWSLFPVIPPSPFVEVPQNCFCRVSVGQRALMGVELAWFWV